ncbi:phosphoribosylformylglycinamidine cyclo-ligase [Commensalibacter oyaizuii]|uniref:Phosphoribosylformylglycinamidine cyclo-ligase n=1 Tax=Commensalibacter oyaizuii TaxID=3043873 RepID=A0ABT6PYW5_9PROT|nr:phosphoribosylformylglycinamidine cyclo-ligase [Commensalibacter sp. TBRC 16381]MDI2090051.1 phosphoribosylformylglycinamidine cyclo-ligase [Commensalibacter sp. TBRC 16381]
MTSDSLELKQTNIENGATYEQSGVDIAAGDALIEAIKPAVSKTSQAGVMGNLGGFGALFDVKAAGFKDPILVSGTDGVGTKLLIAIETGLCDHIGFDLVGMCVNDLIVQGAKPLFFLDYFATGKLDIKQAQRVITGISTACEQCGCALIGGETAEMPGMYHNDHYDLAGFSVGAVERNALLPQNIVPGNKIIGLTSNGAHSNGYSLIRSIVKSQNLAWDDIAPFDPDQFLGEALLTPTKLYVEPVIKLHNAGLLHGAAHITGGGIIGNLPRILPKGTIATIDGESWPMPPVFSWLAHAGNVKTEEMLKVFNCGIGMILIVSDVAAVNELLNDTDTEAYVIGHIAANDDPNSDPVVEFSDLPDFTFVPEEE